MASELMSVLEDSTRRRSLERGCVALVEAEVGGKRGVSGLAIKAAFKVVKRFRPDIIERVICDLLPEFIAAMDDAYREAQESSTPIERFISANEARVANDLLRVTDRRAETSKNEVLVSAYRKLRPMGEAQVKAALPRLGALLKDQGL